MIVFRVGGWGGGGGGRGEVGGRWGEVGWGVGAGQLLSDARMHIDDGPCDWAGNCPKRSG